jgi:hypothetical protein
MNHELARWAVIAGLALSSGPAFAESAGGHDAVALAAIVGGYSPVLSARQRMVLAKLLNGDATVAPRMRRFSVEADSVVCGASDVDITQFHCDLKFGGRTEHFTGKSAHELFATIASVGVDSDGAAGTIYEAVYTLRCTIKPAEIAQRGGGGADCDYSLTRP